MRRLDPLLIPQLAVPIAVIIQAYMAAYAATTTNRIRAIADLIIIAFYFLLRVGEYTRPRQVRVKNGKGQCATRTEQFQVKNVGFFKAGKVLPHTVPPEE